MQVLNDIDNMIILLYSTYFAYQSNRWGILKALGLSVWLAWCKACFRSCICL